MQSDRFIHSGGEYRESSIVVAKYPLSCAEKQNPRGVYTVASDVQWKPRRDTIARRKQESISGACDERM
jgi:hypothetical protein